MPNNELSWNDFIKLWKTQKLLNEFSALTGISLVIIDTDGKHITLQTLPHNRICLELIKKTTLGLKNCINCDAHWAIIAAKEGTHKIYTCKNGLVDFVTPIIIENEVKAYLYGGQIRLRSANHNHKNFDLDVIDKQVKKGELIAIPNEWYEIHARRLGIEPVLFSKALKELPLLKIEKIEAIARMLSNVADTIAMLISQNLATQKDLISQERVLDQIKNLVKSQDNTKGILDDLNKIIPYQKASLQIINGDSRSLIDCRGFKTEEVDDRFLLPISQDRLIKRIIKSKEPLIISNTENDIDWNSLEGTKDVRSWVGMPIVYNESIIGLITLDHNKTGYYTTKIKNDLIAFSNKIASYIWNSIILNNANILIRNMSIVNDIVKLINAEIEVENILKIIVQKITNNLNCTHCTIFLSEMENGKDVLVAKYTEGYGEKTLERKFMPGEGLAGYVYITGEVIRTPDARKHPKFVAARKSKTLPRSMLVIPVKVGERTIGVISADQDAYNWFTETDTQLIVALAQHAGIAIHRSNNMKSLKNIGNKILTVNDIDEILSILVSGAIDLVNVTSGVIYLISKDGRSFINKFHLPDYNHPLPRLEKEDGLTRTVIDTGLPISIPDTRIDYRVNSVLKETFISILGVPIKINNEVIGVFFLDDKIKHNFTEIEISLLSTLADQAAIAIQNIGLRKSLKSDLEIHSLLEDILVNLVIENEDQDETLNRIGEGIIKLLGLEVSPTINLYYEERDEFDEVHSFGPMAKSKVLNVQPRSENGTGRYVLKTKESLFIEDVKNPPPGCPTIRKESIDAGIVSFAAIPLKRKNYIVGILFVNSQKKLEFNEKIKQVLEIFASQAGLAIEISRLHQATVYGALMKAADLGFLASGIAHEFFNNLQNFKSLLFQIKREPENNKINDLVNVFLTEISRATQTIDIFRNFRDQGDIVTNFDLDELVKNIIEEIKSRFKDHGIEILYSNDKIKEVRMNPNMVRSIIINLLRNATDAVESVTGKKMITLIISKTNENTIEIAVSDSGKGISQENQNKIFLPYFSSKKSENLGIGLSIVQKSIKEMGGEIKFDKKNSMGGATFRVLLPI